MDATKIGNVIHELRVKNGLTQLQLAEKLNVTDKAVSKWELGVSIPDLQQLESITILFGISYDSLLNGDIEKIRLISNKVEPEHKEKEKFDSREWYLLDNAAKVYPPQARDGWNSVFRMAAVLKEDVDIDILNKALEDMVDRFPTFMVSLKRGFFWYYFDKMEKTPKAVIGGNHPCIAMPLDGKKHLFRVSIENKRVACDYFHSLTDGTGGTVFLVSLLTRYYELKYGPIKDYKMALNVLDKVKEEEIEDSFYRYAQKHNYIGRPVKSAYHLKGKRTRKNIITHVVMKVDELKELAKKYNCTITVLLTAVLMRACLKKKMYDRDKKPIIIQIPINLRKRFPSETLRNFSYFTGVETDATELSLQEAVDITKSELEKGTNLDFLQKNINSNVREERNIFIKFAPLTLKNFVLSIVSEIIGGAGFTITFSNVGNLNTPEELKSIVDRFEFVLKENRKGGVDMTGIAFNNKCTITFDRSFKESTIEREFVRELTGLGIGAYVESNGGDI